MLGHLVHADPMNLLEKREICVLSRHAYSQPWSWMKLLHKRVQRQYGEENLFLLWMDFLSLSQSHYLRLESIFRNPLVTTSSCAFYCSPREINDIIKLTLVQVGIVQKAWVYFDQCPKKKVLSTENQNFLVRNISNQ